MQTHTTRRAALPLSMPKPLPGPSRLSKILQNLTRAPRPTLVGVKSVTLTLAQRNDHFGARYDPQPNAQTAHRTHLSYSHFLKEEMPRIRYANPKIDIRVHKLPKTMEEAWKPELILEFCSSSFTANALPEVSLRCHSTQHSRWS